MKRLAYTAVAAFILLVALAAAPASAQFTDAMTAEVPFAFEVASTKLEAGRYTVTPLAGAAALLISSEEGRQGVIVLCWDARVTGERPSTRRLVFHKYADQYFLASAWVGDEGKEVRQSRRERRLRRELTRGQVAGTAGAKPEVVTVAAAAR